MNDGGIGVLRKGVFFDVCKNIFQRSFFAAGNFLNHAQFAVSVEIEHDFQLDQRAYSCRRAAQPAAAL